MKAINEYIASQQGELRARDRQHRQNQWLLGVIIGLIGLLFSFEAFKKDHSAPQPQKQTQTAPGPAHSEIPDLAAER